MNLKFCIGNLYYINKDGKDSVVGKLVYSDSSILKFCFNKKGTKESITSFMVISLDDIKCGKVLLKPFNASCIKCAIIDH